MFAPRPLRRSSVVLFAALALSACTTSSGEDPSPTSTTTSGWAAPAPPTTGDALPRDLVPALGEPQDAQDILPSSEGGTTPVLGLDTSSTRYLGTTRRARYWVALAEDGTICLVDALGSAGADVVGTTCASRQTFAEGGIRAGSTSSTTATTGYLVPRGFTVDDAGTEQDWVVVADNLLAPSDQAWTQEPGVPGGTPPGRPASR